MKNQIRVLRKSKDWTQLELAIKVQVRRETISFLEKGTYNPSLGLAHRLAQCFDVTIEELFLLNASADGTAPDNTE